MMMIDTNVVIDLVTPESRWFAWAVRTLSSARVERSVTASTIVVAELAAYAGEKGDIIPKLGRLGIGIVDFDVSSAVLAGRAQAAYRSAGGTREKLLGDFLIGAHAATRKVPLATRDPRP